MSNQDRGNEQEQAEPVKKELGHSSTSNSDSLRGGFDAKSLVLPTNFANLQETRKRIATIPAGRPNKQAYIRTHPSPAYRVGLAILMYDNDMYAVDPGLIAQLEDEIVFKDTRLTIDLDGALGLWLIGRPKDEGTTNSWHESANEVAEMAEHSWVRLLSDRSGQRYYALEALGSHPEPKWPDIGLEEVLEKAFKNKHIQDLDHVVIQKLRGLK